VKKRDENTLITRDLGLLNVKQMEARPRNPPEPQAFAVYHK
jgi:hypothetical protein